MGLYGVKKSLSKCIFLLSFSFSKENALSLGLDVKDTLTKFQVPTNLSLVICLMEVIVVISCRCTRQFLSVDNVLCIVPFTGEHLITEVILSFNLRKKGVRYVI